MKCEICGENMWFFQSIGKIDPTPVCTNPNCEENKAVKHDKGKLRYDLLPTDSLKEVVKVFTYGVEKYDDRNWEKGMEWGRIYGAIQRHLNAFWSGEEINEEDGNLSHLAQAAWGCIVLEAYRLRKVGKDTRENNGTNNSK